MPLVPLAPFKVPRKAAAAQVAQVFNIPASVGGLNYRDPISEMDPRDALVLTNFIPRQQGVEIRKGWKIHTETVNATIESVFSFKSQSGPEDDRIFAAADGDIFDVTTNPPSTAVTDTGSDADEWFTTMFATPGNTFLLAVSPGAGYWTYDATTGWQQRTPTNLPTTVRTVMVWKRRVWFTCENDTNVYYMDDVDAVDGSVTAFPMGSTLRNGGYVSALINWTIDAGFSVDDFLVCVGTEGDLSVWEGTDPTSADTFRQKGVWYVGPVPRHGQYWTGFGGDVMIVSQQGLVPMSKLVSGQFTDVQQGPASKIQPVLVQLVAELLNERYWDVFPVPSSQVLIIKLPPKGGVYTQFAMNVVTGAWGQFTGIPMRATAMLGGQLYFGTSDGRVAKGLFGDTDGASRTADDGNFIQADIQTAFNAFNTPANLKKFGMAKPIFIAPTAPSVKVRINTQYAFSNVSGSPSYAGNPDSRWDLSEWNVARWMGEANTYQAWVGTTGLGYYAALRMKVQGVPGTVFTSCLQMTELGGVM
jgi:hypothetical protein